MKNKKHIVTGILAHVDAGKTTLSEAILYTAGNLRKIGRVDNGDAFLDTYELERSRGITIFSKQAEVSMNEMDLTLLDTPGHVDFSAEMERTLQVLDYAVLVISGADGVQGHTLTLPGGWRQGERGGRCARHRSRSRRVRRCRTCGRPRRAPSGSSRACAAHGPWRPA